MGNLICATTVDHDDQLFRTPANGLTPDAEHQFSEPVNVLTPF